MNLLLIKCQLQFNIYTNYIYVYLIGYLCIQIIYNRYINKFNYSILYPCKRAKCKFTNITTMQKHIKKRIEI